MIKHPFAKLDPRHDDVMFNDQWPPLVRPAYIGLSDWLDLWERETWPHETEPFRRLDVSGGAVTVDDWTWKRPPSVTPGVWVCFWGNFSFKNLPRTNRMAESAWRDAKIKGHLP